MAIQDDAKNFLLSALSRAGGDLPSLQLEWLATQGYTRGTIDDRWQAYLAANAYYLPEGLSRLLVGLNRAIGNNWTPNLLFQSGDILLWYDPSDLTTMFTDTAGTTQVSADGDSVALMLDKGQWGGKTLEQVKAAATERLSIGTIQTLLSPGSTATYNTGTGVGTVYRDANGYSGINFAVSGFVAVDITSDSTSLALRNAEQSGTILKQTSVGRNTYIVGPVASLSLSMSAITSANVTVHSIKEIPGYHRIQATGTSMPKYKTDGTLHWLLYDGTDDGHATGTIPFNTVTSDGLARRNLLTEPDKFDHTTWTKTATTVSANEIAGPDGTTTADRLICSASTATHTLAQNVTVPAASAVVGFVDLKYSDWQYMTVYITDGVAKNYAVLVDVQNGLIVGNHTGFTAYAAPTSSSIEALDNGFYRVKLFVQLDSGRTIAGTSVAFAASGSVATGPNFLGTGQSVFVAAAQTELGSTATDFQNIGTDEVAVCAGVTKSSDISGVIVEHSASIASNNGAFSLINVTVSPSAWRFAAKGTTQSDALGSNLAAPLTSVLTGQGKIATDLSTLRRDGVQTSTSATDQGTGNFGSYPMYFGRRGGSSLPFNGREYQTVIRSRLLSAAELSSLETFVAAKTGVIL